MIQVEYIANYLGVDFSNKLILKDIGEIKDKYAFIEFMKKHINHTTLEFKNGLQKLTELKKMYQDEINAPRMEKFKNEAKKLNDKFNYIKNTLLNEQNKGKFPRLEFLSTNGRDYFSSFELEHLNKIGNIKKLIFLANNGLLFGKIEDSFKKVIEKNNKKGEQKVLQNKTTKNNITLDFKVKRF